MLLDLTRTTTIRRPAGRRTRAMHEDARVKVTVRLPAGLVKRAKLHVIARDVPGGLQGLIERLLAKHLGGRR